MWETGLTQIHVYMKTLNMVFKNESKGSRLLRHGLPAQVKVTISVQQSQAPALDAALCVSLVPPLPRAGSGRGQLSVVQQLPTLDANSGVGKVFLALAWQALRPHDRLDSCSRHFGNIVSIARAATEMTDLPSELWVRSTAEGMGKEGFRLP